MIGWADSLTVPQQADDGGSLRRFREDPVAHPLRTPSGRIEIFSKKIAGHGARMNPRDARVRGIADGDIIRLSECARARHRHLILRARMHRSARNG